MNKLVFTLVSFMCISNCFSQVSMSPNVLASPFQGERFKVKTDFEVEGTPLLFDDWKPGEVTLTTGEVFQLQKINFDGSTSRFVYSVNDTLYEFQDNVSEIKVLNKDEGGSSYEMLFRKDLLPSGKAFAQVLAKGKVTILREFIKRPEGENYSNGIVNNSRKYVLHTSDVAVINSQVTPFKYSASDLETLTSDKKSQVDAFVKSNGL